MLKVMCLVEAHQGGIVLYMGNSSLSSGISRTTLDTHSEDIDF